MGITLAAMCTAFANPEGPKASLDEEDLPEQEETVLEPPPMTRIEYGGLVVYPELGLLPLARVRKECSNRNMELPDAQSDDAIRSLRSTLVGMQLLPAIRHQNFTHMYFGQEYDITRSAWRSPTSGRLFSKMYSSPVGMFGTKDQVGWKNVGGNSLVADQNCHWMLRTWTTGPPSAERDAEIVCYASGHDESRYITGLKHKNKHVDSLDIGQAHVICRPKAGSAPEDPDAGGRPLQAVPDARVQDLCAAAAHGLILKADSQTLRYEVRWEEFRAKVGLTPSARKKRASEDSEETGEDEAGGESEDEKRVRRGLLIGQVGTLAFGAFNALKELLLNGADAVSHAAMGVKVEELADAVRRQADVVGLLSVGQAELRQHVDSVQHELDIVRDAVSNQRSELHFALHLGEVINAGRDIDDMISRYYIEWDRSLTAATRGRLAGALINHKATSEMASSLMRESHLVLDTSDDHTAVVVDPYSLNLKEFSFNLFVVYAGLGAARQIWEQIPMPVTTQDGDRVIPRLWPTYFVYRNGKTRFQEVTEKELQECQRGPCVPLEPVIPVESVACGPSLWSLAEFPANATARCVMDEAPATFLRPTPHCLLYSVEKPVSVMFSCKADQEGGAAIRLNGTGCLASPGPGCELLFPGSRKSYRGAPNIISDQNLQKGDHGVSNYFAGIQNATSMLWPNVLIEEADPVGALKETVAATSRGWQFSAAALGIFVLLVVFMALGCGLKARTWARRYRRYFVELVNEVEPAEGSELQRFHPPPPPPGGGQIRKNKPRSKTRGAQPKAAPRPPQRPFGATRLGKPKKALKIKEVGSAFVEIETLATAAPLIGNREEGVGTSVTPPPALASFRDEVSGAPENAYLDLDLLRSLELPDSTGQNTATSSTETTTSGSATTRGVSFAQWRDEAVASPRRRRRPRLPLESLGTSTDASSILYGNKNPLSMLPNASSRMAQAGAVIKTALEMIGDEKKKKKKREENGVADWERPPPRLGVPVPPTVSPPTPEAPALAEAAAAGTAAATSGVPCLPNGGFSTRPSLLEMPSLPEEDLEQDEALPTPPELPADPLAASGTFDRLLSLRQEMPASPEHALRPSNIRRSDEEAREINRRQQRADEERQEALQPPARHLVRAAPVRVVGDAGPTE